VGISGSLLPIGVKVTIKNYPPPPLDRAWIVQRGNAAVTMRSGLTVR